MVRSTLTGSKFGKNLDKKLGFSTSGFQLQDKTSGINFRIQFRDISETLTNLTDMVWEISEDDDFETFSTFYD